MPSSGSSAQNPALNSRKTGPKHLPSNFAPCQQFQCDDTSPPIKPCAYAPSLSLVVGFPQMPRRKGADGNTSFADHLLFTGVHVGLLRGSTNLVYQANTGALESEKHSFKSWLWHLMKFNISA